MSEFDLNNELEINPTQTQILSLPPFNLLYTYDKYLHLKIYVNDNNYPGLKQKYIEGDVLWMTPVLICLIIGMALSIERVVYLNLATINNNAP